MITVRTRRKSFMTQEQFAGRREAEFILSLGRNFLAFVDRYSDSEDYEASKLYSTVENLVKENDVEGIRKVLASIQVFGTYDKVAKITTKYKNIITAVGPTYNGTVYYENPDEKNELDRIISHTCSLCSPDGDEQLGNLLA
ncbi:hypothetical protein [Pseudobutyrivibrio sp.]|uniref:hypothetical protein n=1 Tax=Pseudobutyrivibrio sp. TaxID=2014367 RepID=UPI0025E49FC9|nr:hypothetical protein [Pseudobutyrivibrio sp.]